MLRQPIPNYPMYIIYLFIVGIGIIHDGSILQDQDIKCCILSQTLLKHRYLIGMTLLRHHRFLTDLNQFVANSHPSISLSATKE